MRNLLVALVGFLVGGGLVVALVVALPETTSATVTQAPATSAMPMGSGMGSMMMGGATAPTARKLTIQHIERGCHVWSNGTTTAAVMRLTLQPGQHLSIRDMDVDAHQMLQFAGPAHLSLGRPMMMNHSVTLSFPKVGVYRLGTKTVPMPGGMNMDVKTIGPDNHLRLEVTVAWRQENAPRVLGAGAAGL
jgi:hypothetical protein